MPTIRLPMPHAGQIAVRRQSKRFNWLCAGRRWRKTTLCMSISVEAAAQGKTWVWGAPTYKQSRIGFEETKRAAGRVAKFNESRMIATFPTGGIIHYVSLDKYQNIRGLTADGATIDEIQSVKKEAYQEVIRPMLVDTGGEFWGIGTSDGHDWFWVERKKAKALPDAMSWNAPTLGVSIVDKELIRQPHPLENPYIPFDEIKSMYDSVAEYAFRREIISDDDAVASGLVYDVWQDGYPEAQKGNVTKQADYIKGAGEVIWAVDDGYTGKIDKTTKTFTGNSHPRVFLLCQLRRDGRLVVFHESYMLKTQDREHIQSVLKLPYPIPDYAAVDKSAAQLMGLLNRMGIATQKGASSVDESIKEMRAWIGADKNNYRRVLVHPRCRHLRHEFSSYRYGDNDKPIKEFDHGLDALRYLIWRLRYERV